MKRQKRLDLTGGVFGRWKVIEKVVQRGKRGEVFWSCVCSCGNTADVLGRNLASGGSVSCGCYRLEQVSTHKMTAMPVFKSWHSMKQRCLNQNSPDYPKYGGRGISVCERWVNSFDNFFADMGDRPKDTSLERKEVNGNYEPSNCKWATRSEQQRNKTTTKNLEWNGIIKSIPDWADEVGISSKIIADRLRVGWSIHDALTKPNRKSK